MIRKITISVLSILFLAFLAFPLPAHAASHIICIDPGHGGSDPGAIYQGLQEKNVALDVATRLQILLQSVGYNVIMTRTSDSTLDNSQRATICNNAHAETLLSIHLNTSTNHSVDYTLGLYGKKQKDQAFAKIVNTAMSGLSIANNGITNFADGLLLKVAMPATLAETVFISSDYEYHLLTDGTGNRQQQIAQVLLQGLNSWFGL